MKADALFGSVVRRVAKDMRGVRLPGRGKEKRKKLEHIRIKLYDKYLAEKLASIYKGFPSIEGLPAYVRDMLEARVGIEKLKQALGHVKSVLRVLESIRDESLFELRRAKNEHDAYRVRRRYLARVYDVLRSLDEDLRLISFARLQLRRIPPVREDLPTVVIGGLPNAGKSSLLRALTGSEPEIAPYPFTTKRLLIGHFSDGYRLVQVIDTPGILDRPPEKMKPEEKEALLSMKHFADLVLFIIDPFQDLGAQLNLLDQLRRMIQKPFLPVVGKADLVENPEALAEELGAAMAVSPLTGYNVERLKERIKKELEGVKWY